MRVYREDRTIYCGIYRITAPNGKEYVGQSKDVLFRWHSYHRKGGVHSYQKLYKSFEEFGVDEHLFELVEECCKGDLRKREQYYINLWQTDINGLNAHKKDYGPKIGTKMSKIGILKKSLGRIGKPSSKKGNFYNTKASCKIRNTQTGEEWISSAQCAHHYGVSPSCIRYRLKVNKNNLIRL